MTDWLLALLKGIPEELQVIILSALPITELRGTIPVALYFGMSPWKAYVFAVLGNLLPIIPILLWMKPISIKLQRFRRARSFFNWLFARTNRHRRQVDKYGPWGLLLFVAIPLPGTGAWTGALLAFFLGLPFWTSFFAVAAGVVLAGVAVLSAATGIQMVAQYLVDAEILVLIGLAAGVFYLWRRRRLRRK